MPRRNVRVREITDAHGADELNVILGKIAKFAWLYHR
jgi:hypothetical protein